MARYFLPAVRLRMYSLRFFLGFLGSSVAAPLVGLLHQSTGELTVVTLALAELSPELAPAPA